MNDAKTMEIGTSHGRVHPERGAWFAAGATAMMGACGAMIAAGTLNMGLNGYLTSGVAAAVVGVIVWILGWYEAQANAARIGILTFAGMLGGGALASAAAAFETGVFHTVIILLCLAGVAGMAALTHSLKSGSA